jgi:hypothetical protein
MLVKAASGCALLLTTVILVVSGCRQPPEDWTPLLELQAGSPDSAHALHALAIEMEDFVVKADLFIDGTA